MVFTCGEPAPIGCSLAKRRIRRGARALVSNPGRRAARSDASCEPMAGFKPKVFQLKRAARSGLTVKGEEKKKKKDQAVPDKTNQPSEMLDLQADLQAEPL